MQNALTDQITSYKSPLSTRYASQEMSYIFSDHFKYSTWRKLWIALAKAEKKLGLAITDSQIHELEKKVDVIDLDLAASYENKVHHDVMAHILTYGDACPNSRGIIHLGATSCFVTDNTDLIQMQRGLELLIKKLTILIQQLAGFANKWANTPCLGLTHLQPAQPTTVGKRASLWLQDFRLDLQELTMRFQNLHFLGVKGTTGTQASFLQLFDGDHKKVKELEHLVCQQMGFAHTFSVTGQTYPRKQDGFILSSLAQLAVSSHKFSTDLRLLAGFKELEEPFESKQVGSSAMPYKRNPMLSERISGLSRFVISLCENALYTASLQWLERSLDDSANRRLTISESFLTTDAILQLLIKVTSGIVVNEGVIAKRLNEELPFLITESILMAAVSKGGDRQALHEAMRKHSHEVSEGIKQRGESNNLLEKIANDPIFKISKDDIAEIIQTTTLVGRAPEQVFEFLKTIKE
jgi:adenylosuccinate lyase